LSPVRSVLVCPGTKQALRRQRVKATAAERVAAAQAPGGEHEPAQYAVLPNSLYRVARAARLEAATLTEGWRITRWYTSSGATANSRTARRLMARAPVAGRLREQLLKRPRDPVEAPLVREFPGIGPRDEHDIVSGGQPRGVQCTCLTQQALDLVSLYGSADLASHGETDASRLTTLARE